jgi:nicotinamidase-related amidase
MSARRISLTDLAPSATVLLLVDFVNPMNFVGADALAPSAQAAADTTARLRRHLDASGTQVVYANDNYGVWRSDFNALYERVRAVPGVAGAMAARLRPRQRDCTLLKPRHSAFYATPLDLLLRQLKCRRLVITGIAADNCIFFTAMDAYLRGYSIWVPQDCVAAESAADKAQALRLMQRALKADVRNAFAMPVDKR